MSLHSQKSAYEALIEEIRLKSKEKEESIIKIDQFLTQSQINAETSSFYSSTPTDNDRITKVGTHLGHKYGVAAMNDML